MMILARENPHNQEAGFSFVELLIFMVLVSVVMLSVSSGILSTHELTRSTDREYTVLSHSEVLASTLRRLSFGGTDSFAAANQIAALIEREGAETANPPATLRELRGSSPIAWTYEGTDALADGVWQITIDSDVDGNGEVDGVTEGNSDLIGIKISFDGRLLLEFNRSQGADE